jgi:hypothetical protein
MPLGEKYDSLRLSPARRQPQSAYQQPARRRRAACWPGRERVQAGLCCGCQGAAVERGRCRYAGLDGSRLCTRAGSAGHGPGADVWRGMTVELTWHLDIGLGSPGQQPARWRALHRGAPGATLGRARAGVIVVSVRDVTFALATAAPAAAAPPQSSPAAGAAPARHLR